MPTIVPARRRSPKVRRLARQHQLELRSVPGTGPGGRVLPRDVLRAAGRPHATQPDAVLASPAARRLLRSAEVDVDAVVRAADGRPLTRADAERLVAELAATAAPQDTAGAPASSSSHATDATGGALEVDVAELLALVAAARTDFVARHGFELGLEVPVGAAAATVLARRPAMAGAPVHVGFHTADGDDVRVVADAQDLTVAGLARRSRAAPPAAADAPRPTPTITITTAPNAPLGELAAGAEVGVLVLGEHALRESRGTDHLGHEVVHTRPHVPVRLHHDGRVDAEEAGVLLTMLGEALTSWTRPVDS